MRKSSAYAGVLRRPCDRQHTSFTERLRAAPPAREQPVTTSGRGAGGRSARWLRRRSPSAPPGTAAMPKRWAAPTQAAGRRPAIESGHHLGQRSGSLLPIGAGLTLVHALQHPAVAQRDHGPTQQRLHGASHSSARSRPAPGRGARSATAGPAGGREHDGRTGSRRRRRARSSPTTIHTGAAVERVRRRRSACAASARRPPGSGRPRCPGTARALPAGAARPPRGRSSGAPSKR